MTELIKEGAVRQNSTHLYDLDLYRITKEGLTKIEDLTFPIQLVKGSKEVDGGQSGVTTEQLLWVALSYLRDVNQGDFRTKDTSLAITHIEDALLRIENRTQDRKARNVVSTYNK